MKILVKFMVVLAAVNIMLYPVLPVYCEEEKEIDKKAEKLEHMKKYAAEIEKNLDESLDHLDKERTYFVDDKEQQKYADYNKSILEMRQFEIDLMKKMIKAANDNDPNSIERLEQEKNKVAQEIYLMELKKENEYMINTYNKDYTDYLDDKKINSGIQLVDESYHDVINAQEALYEAEKNLKDAYDKKEKAVKLMDVYLLEAQKNKKIKELSE